MFGAWLARIGNYKQTLVGLMTPHNAQLRITTLELARAICGFPHSFPRCILSKDLWLADATLLVISCSKCIVRKFDRLLCHALRQTWPTRSGELRRPGDKGGDILAHSRLWDGRSSLAIWICQQPSSIVTPPCMDNLPVGRVCSVQFPLWMDGFAVMHAATPSTMTQPLYQDP